MNKIKIKLYCVTYDNNKLLNDWFLKSLYRSNYPRDSIKVFVIDNHSNIQINSEYSDVIVIENNLRPDFSKGHLSRNWNQAIINGFVDLNDPDCDLVICCQVDTILNTKWWENIQILNNHTELQKIFFTEGHGDQFVIHSPESVKNIGLYDERFCSIGYQEADYFLRALLHYNEYSVIQDYSHGRVLNPLHVKNMFIEGTESGYRRKDKHHSVSSHPYQLKLFKLKWSRLCNTKYINRRAAGWDVDNILKNKDRFKESIRNFMYYPYFEKNIKMHWL